MNPAGPGPLPIIIPAVIAETEEELECLLAKIGFRASRVQLDVMDGHFVPSLSLSFLLKLPLPAERFEAHLMVTDPAAWIEANGEWVGTIIPHLESSADPHRLIGMIQGKKRRAGLAINPETPVERLSPYLDELDQVLVMTVHPGFYGSPFLPQTLEKVTWLRQKRPDLAIEVDGGIRPETIGLAGRAGANLFVSGSYLLKADDFDAHFTLLEQAISG